VAVLLGQDPGLEGGGRGVRGQREVAVGLEADALGEPLLLADDVAEQAALRWRKWLRAAFSSWTMAVGMIGVAMSCEWACASVAPAWRPLFLKIRT
jgi:hypothetical protein